MRGSAESDKDKSKSAVVKILQKQWRCDSLDAIKLLWTHTSSVELKSITTQNEVDSSLKIMKTD